MQHVKTVNPERIVQVLQPGLRLALTAIAVFLAIRSGVFFSSPDGTALVTPVAGIALTALLLFKWPAFFGVLTGTLAAYGTQAFPLQFVLAAALLVSLPPLLGAMLLRQVQFNPGLNRLRDVLSLLVLGGIVTSLITIGISTLVHVSLGVWNWHEVPDQMLVSWISDAFGVIVFAPLLLRWLGTPLNPLTSHKLAEAGLMAMVLVWVNLLIFGEYGVPHEYGFSLAFLNVPLLLWAALRLGMHGATLRSTMVATVAVVATALDVGPFATSVPTVDLAMVWIYILIVAASTLVLGAIVMENRQAYSTLQQAVLAASRTQVNLLPDATQLGLIERETGLQIAYRYKASQSMGGDVLGVQTTGPDEVCLYLADVAGHGIEASLSAVSLHTFINSTLARTTSPVQLAGAVNQFCQTNLPPETFTTMVFMRFRPSRGAVEAIIAGHPPLIVWSSQGWLRRVQSNLPALGMFADAAENAQPLELHFDRNSRLLVYSDGIIESRNRAGKMYSESQLHQHLRSMSSTPVTDIPAYVIGAAEAWSGSNQDDCDDMTVVAIGSTRDQLMLPNLNSIS